MAAQLRRVVSDLWRRVAARAPAEAAARLRPRPSAASLRPPSLSPAPAAPSASSSSSLATATATATSTSQVPRGDEWAFLQQLESPDAKRLLREERSAAEAYFSDPATRDFEARLQAEAAHVLLPEEEAPAEVQGGFHYYRRYDNEGYTIYCRAPKASGGGGGAAAPEQVTLDTGALAREAGTGLADVTTCKVSDSEDVLAFVVDVQGDESYELRFRGLSTAAASSSSTASSRSRSGVRRRTGGAQAAGAAAADASSDWTARLPEVRSAEFTGAGDAASGLGVLAVRLDPRTKRACGVDHVRVAPDGFVGEQTSLWQEDNEAAYLEVFRTKDRQYVLLSSNTKDTSEVRVVRCGGDARVAPEPLALLERREGVEYFAEHRDGHFYVISNHERPDFAVYLLPSSALGAADGGWPQLRPFFVPPGTLHVTDADLFARWLVLYGHEAATPRICIVPLDGGSAAASAEAETALPGGAYLASLPAAVGSVEPGVNAEAETEAARFTFRSPVEPGATFDLQLATGEVRPLTRRSWSPHAGIGPEDLSCERLEYPTRDGELVPLTLVRPKAESGGGGGPRPCLLNVYGAYGSCLEPDFRVEHIALLRRGWAIAWAHVRGGGERGRLWHLSGRQLDKAKSVLDLADAVTFLLARGVATPGALCLKAASAGGLTAAALLNSPAAARNVAAAVLEVPFVDALSGMLDPSLPLTVHEYAEWGDPHEEAHASNLRSLSPFENVGSHRYPPVYLSCALEDARVPAWMPLKYAARLRARSHGYLGDGASGVRSGVRRRRADASAAASAAEGSAGEPSGSEAPCVLLHCSDGGHGGSMDWHGRSEEFSRQLAFLHRALGLPLH
eukprot:TRINITY_DN10953_c0_g1_i2.p1 TRINITY_DN10953_c0_g1~~TRINITY_DN10953_c0_g1_i2.p1  ORF type:complete len:848 (+),score=224.50 TRINITY_DN10953_c0_g1_i2:164-2707(+)